MNVLFIGPFLTQSGWGIASSLYLRALLKTNNNIACRPIYLSNEPLVAPHSDILPHINKKFDCKPDIIIQNCIPDHFEWYEGYNIGILFTETYNLTNCPWIDKINLMDEIWVSCEDEKNNLINSGVTCAITVFPDPFDCDNPNLFNETNTLNLEFLNNRFIFYSIAEHIDRKNILAFVNAFHREFDAEENVGLLIKSNSPQLQNDINTLKQNMRLKRNYCTEGIIIGNLPEEQIYELHRRCDCLVVSSRAESQCMPITEALYFNNPVICTDGLFCSSMFSNEYLHLVDYFSVPVYTTSPPIPYLYTNNEIWNEINIVDLQNKMREVFNKRPKNNSSRFIESKQSIQSIGNLIRCRLLEISYRK